MYKWNDIIMLSMVAKIFNFFCVQILGSNYCKRILLLYKYLVVTSLILTRVRHPLLIPQLRNLNNCIPCVYNKPISQMQILSSYFSAIRSCTSPQDVPQLQLQDMDSCITYVIINTLPPVQTISGNFSATYSCISSLTYTPNL